MKLKQKIENILPIYAWIPLLFAVVFNFAAYIGGNLISQNKYHYHIDLPIDAMIPVVPFFITFYVLAYVQWILGYIIICRESRERCFRVMTAEVTAKIICLLFFIFFPTTAERDMLTGDGIFIWLTNLVYSVDTPNNLLPSIHCLESYAVFRGAIGLKKTPKWYLPVMLFFSIGVFASTVFLKQHVIIDIPAGILVFELGLLITKLTRSDEKLSALLPPKHNLS